MTTQTYQCTICRRLKKIEVDNKRAIPDLCTITKGCKGILNPVRGIAYVPPVNKDLQDWYPRNKKPVIRVADPEQPRVSMSCSPSGMITLAMWLTEEEAFKYQGLSVEFNQRLASDVSTIEYNYQTFITTQSISGRDLQGKILRFDQAAIDEERVTVKVNGVTSLTAHLSPNTVSFVPPLPPNSTVEVVVYASSPSTKVYMQFVSNHFANFAANTSAWTNIRWFETEPDTDPARKWWVYSATSYGTANGSAFLQLTQIVGKDVNDNLTLLSSATLGFDNGRFVLAAPPYGNADRYLQFYLSASEMALDYKTQTAVGSPSTIYVEYDALVEAYPPFILSHNTADSFSSYISPDQNTADGSTLSVPPLVGQKIIGPV